MIVNPIDKLECQLETLTEGAFARLFRRTISARDIAVLLLRAMEDSAAAPATIHGKPIAPDIYHIHLHPQIANGFLAEYSDFPLRLARLIDDLREESGFQLQAPPRVVLHTNKELTTLQARITAEHSALSHSGTAQMPPVSMMPQQPAAISDPMLHIDGIRVVPLGKSVINIGRETNNDIIIADAYISRHHLQLRKRFGAYTLFDVNSRGGTRVNDKAVVDHRLCNGDVIAIGHSTLVYSDENNGDAVDETTQILPPD
ncbi:MAG: DUF3662 domain-containing protein [Chloroflexi bacterium]|nr:DUF3662 domain-containing protein [Chloroflexota bacterium]